MKNIYYSDVKNDDTDIKTALDEIREDMSKYYKMNHKRRAMQMFFGGRLFTLRFLSSFKNKAYTKAFHAGKNLKVYTGVNFSRAHNINGTMIIGDNVHINGNVHIDFTGDVVIGNDVDIAENCVILSHKHSSMQIIAGNHQYEAKPVRTIICDGAHIQVGCIIYPGVTIGECANVYSGAVVMEDVEPYGIVMGNPARDIREIIKERKVKVKNNRKEIL